MRQAAPRKWSAILPLIAGLLTLWLVGRTKSQSLASVPPAAPNLLVNSDLRKVTNGLPDYWYFDGSLAGKGSVRVAPLAVKPGATSLCLLPNSRNTEPRKPYALAQIIYPEPFLGHKLLAQVSIEVTSGAAGY